MQSQSTEGLCLLASKREEAGCHHTRSLPSGIHKLCSIPSPYCSPRLSLLTFYFVCLFCIKENRMTSASRWHLVTAHTTNALSFSRSFPPFVVQILFSLGPCNPEWPDLLFSGWLHVCWLELSWGCVDLISREYVHRQGFPKRSDQ